MHLKETLTLMLEYNHWANQEHVQFFRNVPESIVEQHVPGSFPSVAKTLKHIRDAQQVWLLRLQGQSPKSFPEVPEGGLAMLYDDLLTTSEALLAYGTDLPEAALKEEMQYTTFSYGAQVSRRDEVLLHVCNHSTYHRGQCVTMARALGLEGIPPTDLIRYLRLAHRQG